MNAAAIAPRAARIPAARAAAVAWLTLAAVTRDAYSLTQAYYWSDARSNQPTDIVAAVDQLEPWAWMTLCDAFGIDYLEEVSA